MYHLLILLLTILSLTATPEAGRGQLTLVVRDRAGTPLPHVQIALIHDANDGRMLVGEARTDAEGQIHYGTLPWGLYIVQFRGSVGQRRILPPDRQNLGLLDDGSGASGGFGVRFAEAARTELFVLATVPGEPHAVPMFDLASSLEASPEPVDPLLATARPTVVPLPSHAPHAQRVNAGAIGVIGLTITALVATVLVGLWRSRRARKEAR
jgi:hypothetical protein